MNLYDFDKSLYRKDCSIEFFKFCFFKCFGIIYFFKILFFFALNITKFISTKKFKEKFFSFLANVKNLDELVNAFWNKEIKNINQTVLATVKRGDVVCSASPEFLISAAISKLSLDGVKVYGTKMDKLTGKIEGENLKGEEKKNLLLAEGYTIFDNVYTDSLSDFPILDLTENKWIVCGKNVYRFGEQKPTFFVKLKYILKTLRIKHYIKNGLIFLPLFFCGYKFEWKNLYLTIIGFVMFCLTASIVYIVNDLADRKKDRLHLRKRKRPIASYMVSPAEAVCMAVLLLAIVVTLIGIVYDFNLYVILTLVCYVVLNLMYSFWLKNIAIVDVFVLALCYLIRVYYGGALIGVGVSKWLYLTVLCASLYMGFGKRRNELKRESSGTRKVNSLYSYEFLDRNLYLCLAMCLMFYALWVINVRTLTLDRINSILLQATIPMVFFILMRYSLNIEKSTNSGDPIEVLLADKFLIFVCILFIAVAAVAMYAPLANVVRI